MIFTHYLQLTELSSQILRVLSSLAETSRRLSEDQATSEIPSLWPVMDFSNLPSYAPQILTSLSAAVGWKEFESD